MRNLSSDRNIIYFSAWRTSLFQSRHGGYASYDEARHVLHREGQEIQAQQRGNLILTIVNCTCRMLPSTFFSQIPELPTQADSAESSLKINPIFPYSDGQI